MNAWRDRMNALRGRTRIGVCRLLLHLAGQEVAPMLGTLNRAAQQAMTSDGDLQVLGEGLVEICQALLQSDFSWRSAAYEGDVFWREDEAADYVDELFTDSAQRYQSGAVLEDLDAEPEPFSVPVTQNVVTMLTLAYEGEVPDLEANLSDITQIKAALKAFINLHYQQRLRAIQVHFSPAQLGDELTSDQLLLNFPELIPL